VKRREFITFQAKALGGLLIYSLTGTPERLQARQQQIKVPLRFLTAAEARVVQAASERIIPSNESGPGATEAGVVIYIDRQLAGPYGQDKYRYTHAPWVDSVPEHGYQGKDNPQQVYRAGIPQLGDFISLSADQQDERLRAIQDSYFFALLRTHTIEGMFCDPLHGGNIDMIGWQLIGFPGPALSYRQDVDKHYGVAHRPKPMSLEQVVGHPVRGMEDIEIG
jgi:gluconate 2-dehydrogenase gamma chain